MADYITLIGSEQVGDAGRAMRAAANTMERAASYCADTFRAQQKFMGCLARPFQAGTGGCQDFKMSNTHETDSPSRALLDKHTLQRKIELFVEAWAPQRERDYHGFVEHLRRLLNAYAEAALQHGSLPEKGVPHDHVRAAAPELLDALKAMQKAAIEFIEHKRATNWGIVNDAYVAAAKAIQKADGK